jgi:2-keto-4-pentenoate hydratase
MWAHAWTHTVHYAPSGIATLPLARLVQPRIEPEVVFRLKAPLPLTDDPHAMLDAVEWVAAGFEIVPSL